MEEVFSQFCLGILAFFCFKFVVAGKETKKDKIKRIGNKFYAMFLGIITLAAAIVPLVITLKPTTEETTTSSINQPGTSWESTTLTAITSSSLGKNLKVY